MSVVAHPIDEIVENLCNEGCKAVRSYIEQLEQNDPVELFEDLDEEEKTTVLQELRSIMAVYDSCQ